MRDIVKVRKVGETLVVTLTHAVLSEVDLAEGDRVLVGPLPPKRIIITKEGKAVANTQRARLEMDVLEQKKRALESEIEFIVAQKNLNVQVDPAAGEVDKAEPRLKQLQWERDKLDLQLAEKRLEMFELQGASTEERPSLTVTGEVIATIGRDPGLRVDQITEIHQLWAEQQIATKLDWFGKGPPVVSIGRKQDIARCRPGDRASLTFTVEERRDGKRGIRTIAFDVQRKA